MGCILNTNKNFGVKGDETFQVKCVINYWIFFFWKVFLKEEISWDD